ncbi:MAG: energy transducer TonB [Verrucomicrobiia bacterium]
MTPPPPLPMWCCQALSLLGHGLLILLGGALLGQAAQFGIDLGTPEPGSPAPAFLQVEVEAEPPPPEPEPQTLLQPEPIHLDPEEPEPLPEPPPKPAPPPPLPPRPAAPSVARSPATSPPGSPGTGPVGATTVSRADYLRNPPPPYPPEAKRLRQQGTVTLLVDVTPDGRADRVTLRSSSGFPLLDQAAQAAVARWRFQPATIGGIRVASQVIVPIRFELDPAR